MDSGIAKVPGVKAPVKPEAKPLETPVAEIDATPITPAPMTLEVDPAQSYPQLDLGGSRGISTSRNNPWATGLMGLFRR
jgi:hypothetical protein